jgi:hypothetical protein
MLVLIGLPREFHFDIKELAISNSEEEIPKLSIWEMWINFKGEFLLGGSKFFWRQ